MADMADESPIASGRRQSVHSVKSEEDLVSFTAEWADPVDDPASKSPTADGGGRASP